MLVVDDELEVLSSLADLLRKEFHVITTDDPAEAVALLGTTEISLFLADQRMPKTTGAKLLAECARISPYTTRVLITGYSDIEVVIEAVNEGAVLKYVAKPWQSEQLLGLVRSAVNQSCQQREGVTLMSRLAGVAQLAPTRDGSAPLGPPRISPAKQNEILRRTVDTFAGAVSVLEQLKVIVPICMHCSKVETTTGEWQHMLEHLMQNSTVLSHGICPECSQPLTARPRDLQP